MALPDLTGRLLGPVGIQASPDTVEAFIAATGDDRDRWRAHVPPSFAARALFAVAPHFLEDAEVAPFTRSLIHTEQAFAWHRPLAMGEDLEVTGRVTGVRARGRLNLVGFAVAASGPGGPWMDGDSSFLMSAEAPPPGAEVAEPARDEKGVDDRPSPEILPGIGAPLPACRRSASRTDLEAYAVAGGDLNPIHLDHAAALAAGLPGIVVHGLLMASWLIQAASRHVTGPHPLSGIRLRFRRPLHPGSEAAVTGTVTAGGILELALSSGGEMLVSAVARVTR
jgi:acyl dehydratase